MHIDRDLALEHVMGVGDEWQSWRALRLSGDEPGPPPPIPAQDAIGGFIGPSGRTSPGATGEGLCHLAVLGLADSGAAVIAADWLDDMRTPAGAWLDPPDEVPGELDAPGGERVWATAAAACGLLVVGRDPGARPLQLMRAEAGPDGGFTGGAYPTFAAAAAYWRAEGPETETAEWALRWAREQEAGWWGPWEWASALTFWAAAGIPLEHASVDAFVDSLAAAAAPEGFNGDLGLTLRTLELLARLGA